MADSLSDLLRAALEGRAVIAGIGNRMRGDDALGPALIDRLQGRVEAHLVDCAEVPERYLGAIAEHRPESILLVDAVDLGAAPGSVAVLGESELPDRLGTTHDTPLRVLMWYLAQETGARVTLLAVQPAQLALDAPMTPEVEATLDALADVISVVLNRVHSGVLEPGSAREGGGTLRHSTTKSVGTMPTRRGAIDRCCRC